LPTALRSVNTSSPLDAVSARWWLTVGRHGQALTKAAAFLQSRACVETLTPRETEVFAYVSKGLMNKQIAYEMKISEIMVKLHRGRMMKKLQSRSLVDVVRKFDQMHQAPRMEVLATQPLEVEDLRS
jgi:FixJ family two-component response regulator